MNIPSPAWEQTLWYCPRPGYPAQHFSVSLGAPYFHEEMGAWAVDVHSSDDDDVRAIFGENAQQANLLGMRLADVCIEMARRDYGALYKSPAAAEAQDATQEF